MAPVVSTQKIRNTERMREDFAVYQTTKEMPRTKAENLEPANSKQAWSRRLYTGNAATDYRINYKWPSSEIENKESRMQKQKKLANDASLLLKRSQAEKDYQTLQRKRDLVERARGQVTYKDISVLCRLHRPPGAIKQLLTKIVSLLMPGRVMSWVDLQCNVLKNQHSFMNLFHRFDKDAAWVTPALLSFCTESWAQPQALKEVTSASYGLALWLKALYNYVLANQRASVKPIIGGWESSTIEVFENCRKIQFQQKNKAVKLEAERVNSNPILRYARYPPQKVHCSEYMDQFRARKF